LPPAITAVRVDNPPTNIGGPVALKALLVALAQPNPWTYTYAGRQPYELDKLAPGVPGQSINDPLFVHPGRTALATELVRIWQPDPWTYTFAGRQPYELDKMAPGVPGQSIDRPPTMLGGPVALKALAAAMAQPDPWTYTYPGRTQPFGPPRLAPGIPGLSVNNPPTALGGPLTLPQALVAFNQADWSNRPPWPWLMTGGRQPYEPRKVSPQQSSVLVDNPPFSHPSRGAAAAAIAAAWVPPPPTFQITLYAPRPFPQRVRPTARGYIIL
jgi:hypothetical protein